MTQAFCKAQIMATLTRQQKKEIYDRWLVAYTG